MTRRIERFHPGNITDEMKPLYEKTTSRILAKRDGSPAMSALLDDSNALNGPPSLWLLSPSIGEVFEQMQDAIRNKMALSAYHMELVIMLVAGSCQSQFEIFAHKLAAASVGLSENDVNRLLEGDPPVHASPDDDTVYQIALSLLSTRSVPDQLYKQAAEILGVQRIFEISVVVGFYQAIALQLETFQVNAP